ncbi:MAG: hypothetical protein ACLFPQ_04625 [Candidatus Woesearchaeota archaeon]
MMQRFVKFNGFGKKAQITIFIIIGIGIIVGGVLLYALLNSGILDEETDRILERISQTNDDTQPIQMYVHTCIKEIGKEAVKKIGMNAGYVNPVADFSVDFEPTESEMIVFGPNKLPYWHYYDDDTGVFGSFAPWLDSEDDPDNSIESQIEKYVDENIGKCLNYFSPFKRQFRINAQEPVSDVTINDEGVIIQLEMPITIRSLDGESSHEMKIFAEKVDVNLKKMHDFAIDLVQEEQFSAFIERLVLELLSMYSGLDSDLPPRYDVTTFDPVEKFWIHHEASSIIRNDILPYINMIQIKDTQNFAVPPESSSKISMSSLSDIATVDLLEPETQDYWDLSVEFFYPGNLRPHIKIGNGNAVLRPTTQGSMDDDNFLTKLLGPVIKIYRFDYDISFPVIAKICDPLAFDKDGFCYFFSMEGNIRSTQPFTPFDVDLSGVLHDAASGTRINSGETIVDLSSPQQRHQRKITFEVVNKNTDESIPSASVYYKCGTEYYIDDTKEIDGKHTFSGNLPFCMSGGKIIVRKKGYHDSVFSFNNHENGPDVILQPLELWPAKEIKIHLRKKSWPDFGQEKNITGLDFILVEISKVREFSGESDFPLVPVFIFGNTSSGSADEFSNNALETISELQDEGHISPGQEGLPAELEEFFEDLELGIDDETDYTDGFFELVNYVELVPGQYNIEFTYSLKGTGSDPALHIDSKTERICAGIEILGICIGSTEKIEYPELDFSTWVVSSYDHTFTVTEEDLYSNDDLVLIFPDLGLPKNHDELGKVSSREDSLNENYFIPYFKTEDDS